MLDTCEKQKAQGNDEFKAGRWREAKVMYIEALRNIMWQSSNAPDPHLLKKEELKPKALELFTSCHLNAALCALKLEDWKAATALCTNVLLRSDPMSSKARYRRGTAFMRLGEYQKAWDDLYQACHLDPSSTEARAALAECEQLRAQTYADEAAMFQRMMGDDKPASQQPATAGDEAARRNRAEQQRRSKREGQGGGSDEVEAPVSEEEAAAREYMRQREAMLNVAQHAASTLHG